MRRLILIFLAIASVSAHGVENMEWPNLTEIKHVSGRPATEKDIDDGSAVFLLRRDGVDIGQPIDMPLPQYAFHTDEETGKKSQVVIIQAETGDGNQVIGAVYIESGEYLVGLIHEFEFLGQELLDD